MDLFINKSKWQTYSPDQMDEYVQRVFAHYKKNGFPYYKLNKSDRIIQFQKLVDFNSKSLLDENRLKQVMLGLNLATYYMPHIFHTRSNKFQSPYDAFCDDDTLLKVIKKRIKYGDNMSDMGLRKTLSWISGTQKVSNFRPTVAKYIYDNYSGNGNVLDFSAGYGGRLFGALSSNKVKSYTGVDPCEKTVKGLQNIVDDFLVKQVRIIQSPFEELQFESNSFDLAFSSPPYFNTEEYDNDETQSYIKFPTKELWRVGFLEKSIRLCFDSIKPNGYFCINVANVKTYPQFENDVIEIATNVGFTLVKTYQMALSALMRSGFKYEPIFIFQKL